MSEKLLISKENILLRVEGFLDKYNVDAFEIETDIREEYIAAESLSGKSTECKAVENAVFIIKGSKP